MTQPAEGQVYRATDGKWYCWPHPTPYESEFAARAGALAAGAPAPPPRADRTILPESPAAPAAGRSVDWSKGTEAVPGFMKKLSPEMDERMLLYAIWRDVRALRSIVTTVVVLSIIGSLLFVWALADAAMESY